MSTTQTITPFNFQRQDVRVITRAGEPWFVAADVCGVLGIANTSDAVKSLHDDERMTLDNTEGHSGRRGGAQFLNLISESGLYALIFKSRKEEAQLFRRWITSEVIPTIRKTGAYQVPTAEPPTPPHPIASQFLLMLQDLMENGVDAEQAAKTAGLVFSGAVQGHANARAAEITAQVSQRVPVYQAPVAAVPVKASSGRPRQGRQAKKTVTLSVDPDLLSQAKDAISGKASMSSVLEDALRARVSMPA